MAAWKFPRYQESDLTDSARRNEWIKELKTTLRELTGQNIDQLNAPLIFEKTQTEGETDSSQQISLSTGETGEDMFGKIDEAHRHKAWCLKLLGTGLTNVQSIGLLKTLHMQALRCTRAMYPSMLSALSSSPESKARDLSHLLWDFFTTLLKVNTLTLMDAEADRLLRQQLARPNTVLQYSQKEMDRMKPAVENLPPCPVTTADLSRTLDRLQGKSWFRLLEQAVQQDDRRLFKSEVLKGATGLTLAGLRSVLGLAPGTDPAVIRQALGARMGRMTTPDNKEYEAQWWQGSAPSGATAEYNYRILPELEPGVEEELRAYSGQDGAPTYIFTKLGITGLYVLAFHAVSLNTLPGPDTTSTYVYLMRPIKQTVQDFIHDWMIDPATGRTGQFEIACAGVIGDPLDERVLREGGFGDQIPEIKQFYKLLSMPQASAVTPAQMPSPSTIAPLPVPPAGQNTP